MKKTVERTADSRAINLSISLPQEIIDIIKESQRRNYSSSFSAEIKRAILKTYREEELLN